MSLEAAALATTLSGANLLLLAALALVWLRNYRLYRNRRVLALVCFAVALAGENVAAIGFALSMGAYYAEGTATVAAATTLRAIQFVALCFLAWATLQ